jgi:Fur family ferric uptake transcriptional regulator
MQQSMSEKRSAVSRIIRQIQARGERVTIQRRLVIEALCDSNDHKTVGQIQQYIQHEHGEHDFSEATIYRILQWLKALDLVAQTDMGAVGIVYALVPDRPHHHLVCLTCGATIKLEDDYFCALRERVRKDFGFAARIDHMAVYGQCRACSEQTSSLPSSS